MSTAPSPCIARPASFDDFDEVAELLHHIFGVRQSVDVLRWKFGGWAGLPAGSTVLTNKRRIVGFLGQVPTRVVVMGHEIQAAQGADVGILEEYRRLDTYLSLTRSSVQEMEKAHVALTYGVANAESTGPLTELLGQPKVAPVPLLVRPLGGRVATASKGVSHCLLRMLAACASVAEVCAAPRPEAGGNGLRTVRLDRFDNRFDSFWRRIRDDYPIMLVRDAAALNWRYGGASGVAYECIGIEDAISGHIEGYAVLSITSRGGTVRGRLCDLITRRRGDRRIAHTLIAASLAWWRAQKAEVADVWMFPHAHLRLALRRHGFFPRRTGPGGFHAGALGTAALHLQGVPQAGNWFLSLGDSDTV